jgi:cyclic pyranopterin monophosphate synthase
VELTHVDAAGAARMVDVSDKVATVRVAVASGVLRTTAEVVELLRRNGLPKGDALATARIAGIMGAKRTPDLVPLCHPIAITGVTLDLELDTASVRITATVRTADRTGVEMEALTAVSVAGLTLHDMIKAVDPAAVLDGVRVERKAGGKAGSWTRPAEEVVTVPDPIVPDRIVPNRTARVVTASNRAAAGVYQDKGGPLIVDWLRVRGFDCPDPAVVRDGAPVGEALRAAVAARVDVVITTGGTGISPTDATPEATEAILDYQVPGIADAIRSYGASADPPVLAAVLSRGVAGVAGRTLVVNLPGSTGGVRDGLAVLAGVLDHAVDQLRGGDHR